MNIKQIASAALLILIINEFIPNQNCDEATRSKFRSKEEFKVGLLVSVSADESLANVFNWTIERLNRRFANGTQLIGYIETYLGANGYSAERSLCKLVDLEVAAIIGPADGYCNAHIATICQHLNIVHYNIQEPEYDFPFDDHLLGTTITTSSASLILNKYSSIDLSISRRFLYEAYLDLILNTLRWEKLIYMYDNDDHLFHFEEAISRRNNIKLKFIIIQMNQAIRNARRVFKRLRTHRLTLILLDVECNEVLDLLKKAQQVNMMTEANAYVILCPDLQFLNMEDFQFSDAVLIWMNPMDLETRDANLMRKQALYFNEETLMPEKLTVKGANIHDSLFSLSRYLNLEQDDYLAHLKPLDETGKDPMYNICNNPITLIERQRQSSHVDSLTKRILKHSKFSGFTGRIEFNERRQRSSVKLNILRQTERGPKVIGNWTLIKGNITEKNSIQLNELDRQLLEQAGKTQFEIKDKLRVVSIINEPFFMLKRHHIFEQGNDRYEGFVVDLMAELGHRVGFDYELAEVPGKHGFGIYDVETNDWDGAIGEIINGKADLAIGGLTITSNREEVIDFTYPFMQTGISILFKRPTHKELSFFSFFEPFKASVWLYVIAAYLTISAALFFVGRLSPREWILCEICRQQRQHLNNPIIEPNKLNEFNLTNSFLVYN